MLASRPMPNREHLRALLESLAPRDVEEATHRERMLALVDMPQCFSRSQLIPGHFTASAFVVSPDLKQTLLIFHAKLQRWLQPGGHIEVDDSTIEQSARREVTEELGLSDLALSCPGIFDVDIHPIPPFKSEAAHEHFDVRFVFQARDLEFSAGDDALSARWFHLDEVSETTSDRSVMRAIEKLRR